MWHAITADVSTEGADRKFSILGCFQRIPYISVSSSPIHVLTADVSTEGADRKFFHFGMFPKNSLYLCQFFTDSYENWIDLLS
jgi:hypothetical protein